MKFFIATKNLKKLAELERILKPLGITPICERDLESPLDEVVEDGLTFKDNALIKARAAVSQLNIPAIADDSGLCVDALNGEPGVYSARYAGEPCDNDKNNQKLLFNMKNVSDEKRTARFISAVACVFPDGREIVVEGRCEGIIAHDVKSGNGFGYDSLFISSLGRFSEISDDEKDSISHRGIALRQLKIELSNILKEDNLC